MANGFNSTGKRIPAARAPGEASKLGSRRIFAPLFKLQVLDSYRNDSDCKGNQRATARKYGIHRRQIQKWLQAEEALRGAARGRRPSSPVQPQPQQPQPLDCSTGRRSPEPCAPVDLSLRRPVSPHPAAWDLSWKPPVYDLNWNVTKVGYEVEAPPPPPPPVVPQNKSYKLFRPYLMDDNFEEVILPTPPCPSAFEQVVPGPAPLSPCPTECEMSPLSPCCAPYARHRHSYTLDFKLQTVRSYYQDLDCRGNQRAVASKFGIHRRQVQKWLQQEDELKRRTEVVS